MTNYYIMDCHPTLECEHYWLSVNDRIRAKRWFSGLAFSPEASNSGLRSPRASIEIETEDDEDQDRIYPVLTWQPIPLMTRSLVAALRAAGVNNLQYYSTRLTNSFHNQASDIYLAVNIVGNIAAADLNGSVLSGYSQDRMIAADFDSLIIDETKIRNLLMFRLAENISTVIVHHSVRTSIEAAGITGVTWFDPGSWAG